MPLVGQYLLNDPLILVLCLEHEQNTCFLQFKYLIILQKILVLDKKDDFICESQGKLFLYVRVAENSIGRCPTPCTHSVLFWSLGQCLHIPLVTLQKYSQFRNLNKGFSCQIPIRCGIYQPRYLHCCQRKEKINLSPFCVLLATKHSRFCTVVHLLKGVALTDIKKCIFSPQCPTVLQGYMA